MSKDKHLGIHIDETTLRKMQYVAKYNGRSGNGHVLFLIRENISEFEKENEEITDDMLATLNK